MHPDRQPSAVLPPLSPEIVRTLSPAATERLAHSIRTFLVESVSNTGGHLGSNLGVVELTLALHRRFLSPVDRIIWDTGHQSYVHKIVTGRAAGFEGLRTPDGLSGYPSRAESEHDFVENSHASTALCYADGMAKADAVRDVRDRHVVAVIGDGSLTGGMAWEALNNLGAGNHKVIIVVNDNGRSYSPTVGAMRHHLTELGATTCERTFFANLSLSYIGPIDGHDLGALESAFDEAKQVSGSVVVHCRTIKGRGHAPAEQDLVDHHHVIRPAAGRAAQTAGWTSVFSDELIDVAATRPDVVAVTAAMLDPVGLTAFARRFPRRVFDVGLAEQHAVASSAGMAMAGLHPVVPIYSTFLNRAFDQVLLDCGLHRCPVTFVLDRAGVTGDDGASHNGMWDLSLLKIVPGLKVAAPRDAPTLREELREAVATRTGPTALRFPKGAPPDDLLAVGCYHGIDVLYGAAAPVHRRDVLLLAVGAMAEACLAAARVLDEAGVSVTVIDPRWVVPLDSAVGSIAGAHRVAVSVEDNTRTGGVGSTFVQLLSDHDIGTPVTVLGVEPGYLRHGDRQQILARMGLSAHGIATAAHALLDRSTVGAGRSTAI